MLVVIAINRRFAEIKLTKKQATQCKKKEKKKNKTETTDVLVGVGVYFWRARPFFLVLIQWERKRCQTAK